MRDVVAHVISYDELSLRSPLAAAVQGRFRTSAINAVTKEGLSTGSPVQLLALLTMHPDPRGLLATLGGRPALVEGIIRHQDIRRTLGRPRAIPAQRLLPALRWALIAPDVGSVWLLRGVRLVAADLHFQPDSAWKSVARPRLCS